MFHKLKLSDLLFMEQDMGAGNGAPDLGTANDVPADTGADEGANTESSETQPEGTEGQESKPEDSETAKLRKDNARMARALAGMQEQLKAKQEREASRKTTSKQEADLADVLAQKGFQVSEDEDGNTVVDYHGTMLSPKAVAELVARDERLAALEGRFASLDEAEEAAKEREVFQGVYQAVQASVIETRSELFPDLEKTEVTIAGEKVKASSVVDDYLLRTTDSLISQAVDGDPYKITEEIVAKAIDSAKEQAKVLFGVFGAKQLETNQTYSENHKVKPDGTAATKTPPKPSSQKEKDSLAAKAAEAALAMRG
jgi:hypothetical protein